jgi:hypothetical protein
MRFNVISIWCAGDVLLSIDDVGVSDKTKFLVTEMLKGRPGSRVTLKFMRSSKDSHTSDTAILDFSALADLSVLSMPDFPTISLPDLSFTPAKASWTGVNRSGLGEIEKIGRNDHYIFEVSIIRGGIRPGILKSVTEQVRQQQQQLHCTALNTARPDYLKQTDPRMSMQQVHCKDLRTNASSIANDGGGRESKFRYVIQTDKKHICMNEL